MNQPKKERFKTSVGGQALMEGIMMRGPKLICCACLLYTSPSPRDRQKSRMPSSA